MTRLMIVAWSSVLRVCGRIARKMAGSADVVGFDGDAAIGAGVANTGGCTDGVDDGCTDRGVVDGADTAAATDATIADTDNSLSGVASLWIGITGLLSETVSTVGQLAKSFEASSPIWAISRFVTIKQPENPCAGVSVAG